MGARGGAGVAPLALLLALSVSPPCAGAAGAQDVADRTLPGCGICYPGGYDINTAGEVRGTILALQTPTAGPVLLVVAGERERWTVLASPGWFWKSVGQHLAPGDSVSVRGSKTLGADGALYLIAREIRPPGDAPVIVLRDRSGLPLWGGNQRGGNAPLGEEGGCRGPGPVRDRNGGAAHHQR